MQARSHIEIPASYVDSPFMVVLYVALAEGAGQLFCFFSSDIRQWRRTPKGHFVLRFTQKTVEGPLQFYRFSEKQMSILKSLISNASDTGVFHEAVYGTGHGVLKFIGGGET